MPLPSKVMFLRDHMHTLRHYPRSCGLCEHDFPGTSTVFDLHAPVRLDACRHIFGKRCIVNWINSTEQDNHNRCPVCRKKLFEREVAPSRANASSSGTTTAQHGARDRAYNDGHHHGSNRAQRAQPDDRAHFNANPNLIRPGEQPPLPLNENERRRQSRRERQQEPNLQQRRSGRSGWF
ncbi:hypothetical protein N0V90_009949 [Kalmusia sp. IMI 367209]|nr:hypothetical protein N0V90_009949 [Kalmusia sp. IMI 367209]